MMFYDFLTQVRCIIPKELQSDAFIRLCEKYKAPIYPLCFLQGSSITLEDSEINCLIELLSTYPVSIIHNSKRVNAFLLLINMGTAPINGSKNSDTFLGKKDARIEQAIINAAIKKKEQQQQAIPEGVPIKRTAIFGLSGNPPTLNHLALIKHLLTDKTYHEVHAILNAQSTLKAIDGYVNPELRYQMLQGMLYENGIDFSRCKLSRLEIDRAPPSRMIVTLSTIVLLSDEALDLTLILGRDALSLAKDGNTLFTHWHYWQAFNKLCRLKFYAREGEELSVDVMARAINTLEANNFDFSIVFKSEEHRDGLLNELRPLVARLNETVFTIENVPTTEGSATDIRNHYLAGNEGVPKGLSQSNDQFIRKNNLFKKQQSELVTHYFWPYLTWFLEQLLEHASELNPFHQITNKF